MIEDEINDQIVEEEDITEEDILLHSTFTGPRIFVLNNESYTNVLGVLLDENEDSFLVGLPATLMTDDATTKVMPFLPIPYFRLMKSSVFCIMYMYGKYTEYYHKYVDEKGKELYPEISEYMDPIEETGIDDFLEGADVITGSVDSDSKEVEVQGEIQGMSNDELKKYLIEKYGEGSLGLGAKKKQ